jgi:hypothetical protein
MQAGVICAEQWLAKQGAIRPYWWWFVGPESDAPKLEQANELEWNRPGWGYVPVGRAERQR